MMEYQGGSVEQMHTVLDNAPMAVFVASVESRELFYINKPARDMLLRDTPAEPVYCYQIAGFEKPCSFCHAGSMSRTELAVREFYRPSDGRTYQLSGKLIDWDGEPAHIEYIQDITQKEEAIQLSQKQEEVNTRKEKERLELYFQTIVSNLSGGIAVVRQKKDGSAVPEFLSDGFAEMTGMTKERAWQLYQEDALTGVHPEDRERVNRQLNTYIASGETHCEMVYRLRKNNRDYIWVKASFTIIQSKDGESSVYVFYRDITKEQAEQEQIRKQYQDMIMQHYSSQASGALVVGHCNITQNRILELMDYTGAELLKTFGSVREEFFLGLSGLIVEKEERQRFLGQFQNEAARIAFENHKTEQSLTCFVKLPGEKTGRYVEFQMNLVEAPDTNDITGILTVSDVTGQIISDRILHQLSVTSYDYVVDLDIGEDSYTVLAYNKNASYIPPPQGTLSGRIANMMRSAILPKDIEQYRKFLEPDRIRQRLEQEGAYTVSYSLTDEKGAVKTKNMTVSAVDLRLGRVCLVCTDITESVQVLEDALTRAEKASRAKSDFLSAMSHDIRTPMNAIMGMTEIATCHLDDREKVEDCLRKISISGKHLLSLINDILDMSRIENSQMVMNKRDSSLSELMGQVFTIIEPQAKSAGLTFTMEQQNISHAYFHGDSLRINQILINLLSNAVKFTPKGEVKLLVEETAPFKEETHIRYRFVVSDTGVGMSKNFLEHLFDPFVRSSKAAQIEGTGLGLSITQGLIKQMDGSIVVESRLGAGSSFTVELEFEPAKNEAAIQTETAWVEAIEFSREKAFFERCFLVAEDNLINAEILCELLGIQGARLVVKTDGKQAVKAFQESRQGEYDAILMDIQMPVMDGYEATEAIRRLNRPDAKTIPIIAMTANAFAEDVQKAKDIGMTAHVAKPIDIDMLRVTLDKALNQVK